MGDRPITYLVTGAAGFIGANFVHFVADKYGADEVNLVLLDALTYAGNLHSIAGLLERDNVTFIHGDINDSDLVNDIFDRYSPDYVVNFAAESHVDRSISDPRTFLVTNVLGTQTLLDAARRAWTDAEAGRKRFLQVSTDEVYGSLSRDYDEARTAKHTAAGADGNPVEIAFDTFGDELFTESTPLAPRSPYSASKAAADMLVGAYGETYGLPVVITRCSNNYGPYQFPEKLIPLIINNVREGRPLPVYGDGRYVRDWLFVTDHVRAIDTVLRRGAPGKVYNIGGLNERQNIDIVKTIIATYAELTGTEPRYDLIRFVADRPGHDRRYAIDPTRAMSELGWAPLTDFDRGIRETVRWYVDHTDWVDDVTSGQYRDYYNQMYSNR